MLRACPNGHIRPKANLSASFVCPSTMRSLLWPKARCTTVRWCSRCIGWRSIAVAWPSFCLALDAFDAGDFAPHRFDAVESAFHVFSRNGHVIGVGVEQCFGIAGDGDVPFPKQQIAATYFACRDRFAQRQLLHVAIARAGKAGGVQRHLYQAGAVDAERGLAAPEVRRVEKLLGRGDIVAATRLEGREMYLGDVPARF